MKSIHLPLPLRRLIVAAAVLSSLGLAAATVRAAGDWAAGSAPLSVAPASAESLAARLADESTRAADLQQQLDALRSSGAGLAIALDAARTRITADTAAAAALRKRLATAKSRLAALEASLARARSAGRITTTAPSATPRPPAGGESESESDG